jgi:signal transduction histidine kinase
MMGRLSLRLRLTLAFALAAAVMLAALGGFLHVRLGAQLDAQIEQGLRQRVADLAETQTTAPAEDIALLDPAQRRAARTQTLHFRRSDPEGDDESIEVLAQPAAGGIVVVSTPLELRDDALAELDGLLALGLPVALLIASLAGFVVAGRLLGRLERGHARERAFVADASHELRTPLARLSAELELALRPGRSEDELRAALASAEDEAHRLTRLSEDLLTVARSDEGKLPLRRERFDVAELLAAVGRRFPEVEAAPPASAIELNADRPRLEQALGNLVDNAQRHGAGRITLEARRDGDAVELHVHDEGKGLPAGFEARAFERFARADAARGGDGAGLGLAIVALIAAAHGGTAGASGADVWLRIPVS